MQKGRGGLHEEKSLEESGEEKRIHEKVCKLSGVRTEGFNRLMETQGVKKGKEEEPDEFLGQRQKSKKRATLTYRPRLDGRKKKKRGRK